VRVLPIRVLGDPVLRQETEVVGGMTPELRRLVDDMFETMHAAKGIGLAAPQVGRRERLAVIEIEGQRVVLVNPEVVASSGTSKREEGCLSIPDVFADVQRPAAVRVRALAEWDAIKGDYPDLRRDLSKEDLAAHPSREDESL